MLGHPNSITEFIPATPDLLDELADEPTTVIHEDNGQWYFWNETWSDREGPFDTRKAAVESLIRYVNWLDGILPEQLAKHGDDGV